jgi:hypothetical protein
MIENQRDLAAEPGELENLSQLMVFEAELEVQAALANLLDTLRERRLSSETRLMALDVVADASGEGTVARVSRSASTAGFPVSTTRATMASIRGSAPDSPAIHRASRKEHDECASASTTTMPPTGTSREARW